jgi:hypothetical protein
MRSEIPERTHLRRPRITPCVVKVGVTSASMDGRCPRGGIMGGRQRPLHWIDQW